LSRRWRKESSIEEEKGSEYGLAPKEVTGGRASRGARGGATDLTTADHAMSMKSPERGERTEAIRVSTAPSPPLG
jgi:hypothetical protein